MKSLTFSYLACDLTDTLLMRYFRKRKLIQKPAVHKAIKFDFQYHYVSLDVQVQVKKKIPWQVSINLLWISITVLLKY